MLLLSENSIILHCHNILYLKKIISTSSYVSIDQHIPSHPSGLYRNFGSSLIL